MTDLRSRNDMLADLAAAINELCEPRTHSEMVEGEERDGQIRRRVRRKVTQTFPGLLDELLAAMSPSSGEDSSAAGFESRPAAELGAVQVMEMIRDQTLDWAKRLGARKRPTLKTRLHGLVSATHSDIQLAALLKDANYWVRRARLATGWDESPITLNLSCPYCFRKHTLTLTADMQKAKCSKCLTEWDEQTIGLLASMLTANQQVETMPQARCEHLYAERQCYKLDWHTYEHIDSAGRWWYTTPNGEPFTEIAI